MQSSRSPMVTALAMQPSVGFLAQGSKGQASRHCLQKPHEDVLTLSALGEEGFSGTRSAAEQILGYTWCPSTCRWGHKCRG